MANLTNKRAKDAAMSARLAPSPLSHRHNPQTWPYHNNLGTKHKRPVSLKEERKEETGTSKGGKYEQYK